MMFTLLLLAVFTGFTASSNYERNEYPLADDEAPLAEPYQEPATEAYPESEVYTPNEGYRAATINYPHMESDVLDLATGLGPAFINGANEFNGLAGEDVDSGGSGGLQYFISFINDFLTTYTDVMSQVDSLITAFKDLRLCYTKLGEADIPSGMMGAIIDSLTVVEEDANTVVENLEGIKSAVGKMVQDPDMNVLGIGILPIVVTTISGNLENMGQANFGIAHAMDKIIMYNQYWLKDLQGPNFANDRNVLELITKMISGLSTEMTTIGHTTSNFSTEFADDVVNNRLGLQKFYPQLNHVMTTLAREFSDVSQDLSAAARGLEYALTNRGAAHTADRAVTEIHDTNAEVPITPDVAKERKERKERRNR